MCGPRIENGMIGDGDGLPEAICLMCGANADDCECDPEDEWDYENYLRRMEEGDV